MTTKEFLCEATATVPSLLVLDDGDPVWELHDGGWKHRMREWDAETDICIARDYYARINGRGGLFAELLIDRPGRVLSFEELRQLSDGMFRNPQSLASFIGNSLRKSQEFSERRLPFYWWDCGRPACYAMKPSVAILFQRAREICR